MNTFLPLLHKIREGWKQNRFPLVPLILLVWTPLLVIVTLNIQHSCYPLIMPNKGLSGECKTEASNPPSSTRKIVVTPPIIKPQPAKTSLVQRIKEHPDISSLTVAGAVAITTILVVGTPLAVAVAVAIGLWAGIRTLITNI